MKITINLELEVSDKITETQKTQIIHKIDECIDELKDSEIISKRYVVAFPFHVHGYSFNGGRSWEKSHELQKYNPYFKTLSKSDFEKVFLNNPVDDES